MKKLEYIYSLLIDNHNLCTDSRLVKKGDIFFALKGESFNGNKFALNALEKGAELAIVDDPKLGHSAKIVVVDDVLGFFQKLAAHHRSLLKIPIIGLTGTNGKTTTKELIACALGSKFRTFATQGNLNNHIGVPISVLSIKHDTEIAIIEMGANHIGEIEQLCTIANPTYGLITNIGKAHLEGFGSPEGVKRAKSELYNHLRNTRGKVFIDSNNEMLINLAMDCQLTDSLIRYGRDEYFVQNISLTDGKLKFSFSMDREKTYSITTQLTGEYNIENVLAAICIGNYFGVSIESAIESIEQYSPSNSRSQLVNTDKNIIILDAYNANPSSMELALVNFSSIPHQYPKVAIIGEMLELGEYSEIEHYNIAKLATNLGFEQIFFIGNHFKGMQTNGRWFSTSLECLNYLNSNHLTEKFILIKGSRGVTMENVLDAL
jgi:UDP-N-acetylmuramoyl-tripeptide--D-alanyl-D-alanine ligase